MLGATSGASLVGNMLEDRGMKSEIPELETEIPGLGVNLAREGTTRADEGTIKAGLDFQFFLILNFEIQRCYQNRPKFNDFYSNIIYLKKRMGHM